MYLLVGKLIVGCRGKVGEHSIIDNIYIYCLVRAFTSQESKRREANMP